MNEAPRIFQIFLFLVVLHASSCTHRHAWVSKKSRHGGKIGYYQSTLNSDRSKTIKDFKEVARKLCKSKRWRVTKELIPPPLSAVSAGRNALKGDARGALESGAQVAIHGVLYRSKRVNKKVKVGYGSPLNSWNEAEIKCLSGRK